MNDFLTSLLQYYRSRAKTQIFGVFSLWWIIFHAEYFIVLLFVEQSLVYEKNGLLKNEYLNRIYGPGWDSEHLVRFVLPFVLTYLTIWWLPRWVFIHAYRKEKQNDYERQEIKIEHELRIEKLKTASAVRNVKNLEKRETSLKKEKKIEKDNPEVVWEQEYQNFKTLNLYQYFDELIESLYTHGGKIKVYLGGSTSFELDRDLLAYADANALITYDRDKDFISLTEKGRYFVKQYQSTN